MGEQRTNPFGGPRPLVGLVDMPQGLERDRLAGVAAKPKAMMRAAHRQRRRPRRSAHVEDIDLGIRVAPELQGQQCEQDRLACTRRPDDHHMPDVADMS